MRHDPEEEKGMTACNTMRHHMVITLFGNVPEGRDHVWRW
jgi:hypothetical protein